MELHHVIIAAPFLLIVSAVAVVLACFAFVRLCRHLGATALWSAAFCLPLVALFGLKLGPYFGSQTVSRWSYDLMFFVGPPLMLSSAWALWHLASLARHRAVGSTNIAAE